MSNVRGRIAVDVQFTDSTASSGVQSLKTITLQDATEYTTGKVAIVTGTMSTATVSVPRTAVPYLNSLGSQVSMSQWNRLAFSSTGPAGVYFSTSFPAVAGPRSIDGQVALSTIPDAFTASSFISILPDYTAGTSSYTLVIYGT